MPGLKSYKVAVLKSHFFGVDQFFHPTNDSWESHHARLSRAHHYARVSALTRQGAPQQAASLFPAVRRIVRRRSSRGAEDRGRSGRRFAGCSRGLRFVFLGSVQSGSQLSSTSSPMSSPCVCAPHCAPAQLLAALRTRGGLGVCSRLLRASARRLLWRQGVCVGPVLMIMCAPNDSWASDGSGMWVTGPHGQDWIYQVKSASLT